MGMMDDSRVMERRAELAARAMPRNLRPRAALRWVLSPAVRGALESIRRVPGMPSLSGMIDRVRPYSMVHTEELVRLAFAVEDVLRAGIPGQFVECGTWRGGASFLMAAILERRRADPRRRVWMFDSFEGLPQAADIDGASAKRWQQAVDGPGYFDNCTASMEDVRRAASDLGVSDRVEIGQGWFDRTLPATRERIGQIALLRLDGDWYESTKCCLEHLYDQVAPGGYIILDDYLTWDGCAIAVHEFLGSRKLPHRIVTPRGYTGNAIIRKP
jgi:O-methyltransferase